MRKFIAVFFTFCILFGTFGVSSAANETDIDAVLYDVASCIYGAVKDPQVGSVGGEWVIVGLVRSGIEMPDTYYQRYYENANTYIKEHKGILHDKKYTENARVCIAMTAIGKDPRNIAGYNLLLPFGDYEKTVWQGVNGSVWALIALDCGNYEMPINSEAEVQATRAMYVNHILENQTPDGGWALSGEKADADITAMALQALSKYRHDERVEAAIQKGLSCLSDLQNENGGFSNYGKENAESSAQSLVALCTLGISIYDTRFVKNGRTLLDSLLSFYETEKGFRHTTDDSVNQMTTEQCFYALVSVKRSENGEAPFYDMGDVKAVDYGSHAVGLMGKHEDVRIMNSIYPGKTFADIQFHMHQTAIEALSARGIINGKTENTFGPDSTMTRAEFATIIARGLGLSGGENTVFSDVTSGDWFYSYINTAYAYGIIKGVSETAFHPHGTITREEAAVMIARAAKLCGMDTEMNTFAARNILAQFFDYVKVSDWAMGDVAFCYDKKILSDEGMDIQPKEAVTRAEIAEMLYRMLSAAKLL